MKESTERIKLRPNDIYLLKKAGLVVEGEYPEVKSVRVSTNNEKQSVEVPVRAFVMRTNVGKPNQETSTVFLPEQENIIRLSGLEK